MPDVLLVLLPDGLVHYAFPGHTVALCGAERVTNADEAEATEPTCETCRAVWQTEHRR